MSPWNMFNENLRTALCNSVGIGRYVSSANIRQMEDGAEPGAATQVLFGWAKDGRWNERASRGDGTLTIQCESVRNKREAHEMLDAVREVLKSNAVSFGRLVMVGAVEQSALQEAVPSGAGYYSVRADFKVIFAVQRYR